RDGSDFGQVLALLVSEANFPARRKIAWFRGAPRNGRENRWRRTALRHNPLNDLLRIKIDGVALHCIFSR
ncbi:MAG: hypothetical protein ACXU89_14035, partial [Xanthobacteraceae bacterium]